MKDSANYNEKELNDLEGPLQKTKDENKTLKKFTGRYEERVENSEE